MGPSGLKKFLLKCGVFSIGLSLFTAIYAYIDLVYFSVQKASGYVHFRPWLPGLFYPNLTILDSPGVGDIGRGTPWGQPIKINLVIDEFGFRNAPGKFGISNIVIVGDSFADSERAPQEDTPAGALERRIHRNVYTYSDFTVNVLNEYLAEERFKRKPVPVVVVILVERNLGQLPPPKKPSWFEGFRQGILLTKAYRRTLMAPITWLDHFLEFPAYHFLYRMIHPNVHPSSLISERKGSFLFYQGEGAVWNGTDSEIKQTADIVQAYDRIFRGRGTRMIFVPAPNKESAYYFLLGKRNHPCFITKLVRELNHRGVLALDMERVLSERSLRSKKPLYYPDDTHWTPEGIALTADRLVPLVKKALAAEPAHLSRDLPR